MEPLLAIGLLNVALAAVLAVAVFVLSRAWRRPALLHCLWLLVLLKLVSPPLLPLPVLAPDKVAPKPAPPKPDVWVETAPAPAFEPLAFELKVEPAEPDAPAVVILRPRPRVPVEAKPPPAPVEKVDLPTARPIPWRTIAGGVWLAGAGFCLGWALVGLWRFHQLLRHAERAPEAVQCHARALAARMGLWRCPEVWLLPGPLPPLVWAAFGRARLYFPRDLLARLDDDGRGALLTHELAHVCRRDHWVRWLELVAVALYWWCPLAWWARAQLRACEEECCDAWVVEQLPARCYAGAILETVEFLAATPRALPAAASGLGRVEALKRRLTAIMERRHPHDLSGAGRVVVVLLACLLPVLPTRGKTAEPPQPPIAVEPEPPASPVTTPAAPAVEESVTFGPKPLELPSPLRDVELVALMPDGRRLALARGVPNRGADRSPILALAVSPDGQRLAVATEDRRVRVKERATGKVLLTLGGHDDAVTCLAFSPDGRTLVSGSPDTKVIVHDAATGAIKATLTGHTSWVYAAVFSPDGRTLATAGYDRVIRLWDAVAGFKEKGMLEGHAASVRTLAFSSDSQSLASAGSDGSVRVWNVKEGSERHVLTGHSGTVRGLAFAPDDRTLASASEDGTARVWDVKEGKQLLELHGHNGGVWSVAFSPGGRTLVTGGADRTLRVWDAKTGQARKALPGHGDGVTALAFDRDGRTLISAGLDSSVKLWPAVPRAPRRDRLFLVWEVVRGQLRMTPRGPGAPVFRVDVTRDGKVMVSAEDPPSGPEALLFGVRLSADALILTFGPRP